MNDTKMIKRMTDDLSRKGFRADHEKLKFGTNNSKLDGGIITFSTPAGHACPFAKDCQSCTTVKEARSVNTVPDVKKGPHCGFGIQDGKHTKFRCFAAIDESMKPSVREARWHNFLVLKDATNKGINHTADVIQRSLGLL